MKVREPLVLVHHHPGRIRARAEGLRDKAVGDRVLRAMEATPGVVGAKHNASTGSVLVEYEPGMVEANALLARVANAADLGPVMDVRAARRLKPSPAEHAIDAVQVANLITEEISGFRVDLRTLVPAALAGAAVYAFVSQDGERLPRWENLIYWSYQVFTTLHRTEIDASSARHHAEPHDR